MWKGGGSTLFHHDANAFLSRQISVNSSPQVIVPSTTCLYVMISYLLLGTVMFAEWEKWDYLNSAYFCVTSLLKIGFGDFVPGTHAALEGSDDTPETQVKKIPD